MSELWLRLVVDAQTISRNLISLYTFARKIRELQQNKFRIYYMQPIKRYALLGVMRWILVKFYRIARRRQ